MGESVRGYKCFNEHLQCRGFQYKVGKEYKHAGNIKLCGAGFHFCRKPVDVFNYYKFDPKNRVCEIIASGEIINGDDKSVASHIQIVKQLTWHEVLDLVNTGQNNTGLKNSGDGNSGDGNSGHGNSGHGNSGDRNSGDRNSGNRNSGNRNSGNRNSGHGNSGDRNSGDRNSGNRNSGHGNSGDRNSGDRNSGHGNSGHGNSCNQSSGMFCNQTPPIYCFNEPSTLSNLPYIPGPQMTEWISSNDMTDSEKRDNPQWETLGGYLKTIPYKDAWINFWNTTGTETKQRYFQLPNFNPVIFYDITGIDAKDEFEQWKARIRDECLLREKDHY